MAARQQLSEGRCVFGEKLIRQSHRVTTLFLLALLVAACSAPEKVERDVITVEGVVTARGNEPFARYVLESSERNFYVLRLPEEDRPEFQTPARLRVTGRVYVDEWDSRPFTHIDISEWERIE